MIETKSYYLSSFRSLAIGIILTMMGIALTLIGFDIKMSFWDNFQAMIIDFTSIMNFLFSLLLFLFKIGFFFLGWFSLKCRKQIIRAKTNEKGLYFKEITGSNKIEKLAFDLNPLIFLPYSKIINIYYVKNYWSGSYLEIETNSERKKLITLNVLSNSEKKEIYNTVKTHIIKTTVNKVSYVKRF